MVGALESVRNHAARRRIDVTFLPLRPALAAGLSEPHRLRTLGVASPRQFVSLLKARSTTLLFLSSPLASDSL